MFHTQLSIIFAPYKQLPAAETQEQVLDLLIPRHRRTRAFEGYTPFEQCQRMTIASNNLHNFVTCRSTWPSGNQTRNNLIYSAIIAELALSVGARGVHSCSAYLVGPVQVSLACHPRRGFASAMNLSAEAPEGTFVLPTLSPSHAPLKPFSSHLPGFETSAST
jgi:hypothetical protein